MISGFFHPFLRVYKRISALISLLLPIKMFDFTVNKRNVLLLKSRLNKK